MFGSHAKEQQDRDKLYAKSIKRRGSYFKLKNELTVASERAGISLQKATPEQMKKLKAKIKADKIRSQKNKIALQIAAVIASIVVFIVLAVIIRFVFF